MSEQADMDDLSGNLGVWIQNYAAELLLASLLVAWLVELSGFTGLLPLNYSVAFSGILLILQTYVVIIWLVAATGKYAPAKGGSEAAGTDQAT